jgi:hypothetical protein
MLGWLECARKLQFKVSTTCQPIRTNFVYTYILTPSMVYYRNIAWGMERRAAKAVATEKRRKRNTKYHRICKTWYLFHSHSLHFNEFYAAQMCTVNFSVFVCMNMEWGWAKGCEWKGERERHSEQTRKREILAWKNIIILILRIFTSGKNSQ